jgi:flagellar assembly factor FliW
MILNSRTFGEIEVDEDKIYTFPDGLLGFEDARNFVLVEAEELRPLTWMLSIEDPELAFPLADPGYFAERYDVPLAGEDRERLDVEPDDQVAIYVIVNVPDENRPLTANLRGPVVINLGNRVGRQVVLRDDAYSHRQVPLAQAAAVPME